MTLFLTGSPTRYGEPAFTEDNGFLARVKAELAAATGGRHLPRVLLVSAAPDDVAYCTDVMRGMSACIHASGIRTSRIVMLRRRNADRAAELVRWADWVVLCGGHVPTQNRFLHEVGMRELLRQFRGVVMGCSAGSMNCADRVYSHPELPGEAADPAYCRWLRGLGLTGVQLVPHMHQVRHAVVDGLRLFEDIAFPDSWGHRFYTFPDGGYVLQKDGCATLYGEAYEISRGQMRKVSEENKSYSFMNLVFISPHFPQTYWHFCDAARRNGMNVLGIADTPYENLAPELRQSLTDYYRVRSLEDYDEVYRAVAWFAHKYGPIDWIESNNEYWLEQDARLRTAFHVTSGIQADRVAAIRNKSEMKKYYALGGIPTARQIRAAEGHERVRDFARLTGYPVIAKPDSGMGASGTFKLHSEEELDAWFANHAADYPYFVVEEFITGLLVSYDAIVDSHGDPVFENNSVFPTPVMDIVHDNLETCYWTNRDVPAALAEIGRRTVKAFDVRSRYVHLEFFQLDRDREGLGRKGDYVGLEVNMRPPGGYTPDMMNFGHSTDVYQIWGDVVAFDERRKPQDEQYFCAYAGRRDGRAYRYSHDDILQRYGDALCMVERVPAALADDLCDMAYIVRLRTEEEIQPFFDFVTRHG
ncbi:MAG: Type 1 glutamine amidotransferase-like domain-containing protein [Bacteroidales bacterium]|nr:Type 1 glutamine amidotransferase-like domain-containing protein [Bacteroidales bacterium]MBR1645064.1 Type 1 glutamine amidotransferase-like domain-containing protein [Bacteroidales bacterium]